MKTLLIVVITLILTTAVISFFLWFKARYKVGIYYIDLAEEAIEQLKSSGPMDINDLKPENYDHAMDLRGTPTHLCPCGCNIWNVKAIFEEFEIATYFLDMECANCGSMATAPTLLDRKVQE